MMTGISVWQPIVYVAWLVFGFALLRRLATTRTHNVSLTMVLGTLALLLPPIGALLLLFLAFRPKVDDAALPASQAGGS